MTGFHSEFLRVLHERGFVHQITDIGGIDAIAAPSAYIGFDLTAPSLHVGSLIQIMVLRWLARTGGRPVILMGMETTRVGDPSGKSSARPLLSENDIADNHWGISKVLRRLCPEALIVPNDWLSDLNVIDFLRDYGRHFSVSRLLSLESMSSRLSGDGLSVLEFLYPLMQSVDFLNLHRDFGCTIQIGGSDQWGNIVSGVDLIRRVTGEDAFGLTTPLMTNSAGHKMGKTAQGAIWLDPELTSPFDFWQFWRNVEDAKVAEFLRLFTELDLLEIAALIKVGGEALNGAKKVLATEVTRIVHGGSAAEAAQAEAERIFGAGGSPTTHVLPVSRQRLFTGRDRATIADLLVDAGLARSKGEADRLAAQNGVRVNDIVTLDVRRHLTSDDLDDLDGRTITLRVGKKKMVAVRLDET